MQTNYLPWFVERGQGPLLAAAIHDGHQIREELQEFLALPEADRLREEDPFTGDLTAVAPTRLVGMQSRFECDLNRPREKAIYRTPEDAWGLQVWQPAPPATLIARSLAVYDSFYQELQQLLVRMVDRYGRVVVLDLHSYNHRRAGKDSPTANLLENPEVNIGTGTMDRKKWAPVVDRFIVDMRNFDFMGRHLDVRENVKFRGGYFSQWIHAQFPETVCVLSVEFKKFFMNEWTGVPDAAQLDAISRALKSTVWGIHEELVKMETGIRRIIA